jgi:hypothetical protein
MFLFHFDSNDSDGLRGSDEANRPASRDGLGFVGAR